MPDPVHAWAAVAPDGALMTWITHRDRPVVEAQLLSTLYPGSMAAYDDQKACAHAAGWRVVRVEIRLMEDGDV